MAAVDTYNFTISVSILRFPVLGDDISAGILQLKVDNSVPHLLTTIITTCRTNTLKYNWTVYHIT